MQPSMKYMVTVALIVALGGFLMGFDASVISGAVGFIEVEFSLGKIELGWSVSSLALTATGLFSVSQQYCSPFRPSRPHLRRISSGSYLRECWAASVLAQH
jgi:hypothetical protein